ncbi:MAG: transglutaminase family protein [Dermatophilaceae bacterium]
MSEELTDPSDANHTPRVYEVRHRTTYTYEQSVSDSYGRGIFAPRDTPTQRILAHDVDTTPAPHVLTEHADFFGNRSHYLEVRTPHRVLEVVKRSMVAVHWPQVDVAELDEWTVGAAASHLGQSADRIERTTYLLPSQLVETGPPVAAYAARVLGDAAPLGQALVALFGHIHADFRYAKGVTTVKTTLPELLDSRAGVCQDFAHLAVGCLRSVGMPARYVSGYIETRPPPGHEKLAGSDATHAWAAVLVPGPDGGRWVDLDPTNDHFADSRYVVTAWGRDYRDVAPLRGVVFTEGRSSKLTVAVDVIRQPDPALTDLGNGAEGRLPDP